MPATRALDSCCRLVLENERELVERGNREGNGRDEHLHDQDQNQRREDQG
jgi:hypothetical protein